MWKVVGQRLPFAAAVRCIEHVSVVGAVEDHDPSAVPFVGQPAVYKLRDIGLRLVLAGQLDSVGNRPEALFDTRLRASVDLEHPSVGPSRGDPVSELDGQLRFANTAEAHEGDATGWLRTSLVDLVENISTIDEIGIAGEGDSRGGGR